MARKNPRVGHGEDGTPVLDIYPLVGTHGLPLVVVQNLLNERGLAFSVSHFIAGAKADGWNNKTIKARLKEAYIDVHGKEGWPQVETEIDLLLPVESKVKGAVW